jgi:hypothetical protein
VDVPGAMRLWREVLKSGRGKGIGLTCRLYFLDRVIGRPDSVGTVVCSKTLDESVISSFDI